MKKQNFILLLLSIIIIAIDFLAKKISSRIVFCNLLFCVRHAFNQGAAFGLLKGQLVFIIISSFIILLISVFFLFRTEGLQKFSLALIIGGLSSNLIERLVYGYVRDFLAFGFWHSFPSFNIADMANLIGVCLLIFSLIKRK